MKIKNKKILVTGGAGFIGSNLVDRLVENNKVTVIDDLSKGYRLNLTKADESGSLTFVKEDIENLESVKKVMKGIQIVFHLAAVGVRESLNDPLRVHQANVLGSLNLYMAALKNKVERFVHISSSEVYGTALKVPMDESHPLNPETVYGASKLAGELYGRAYFRTYKLPVTVIRPFNTYGPRSPFSGPYGEVIPRFVVRALNGLPPIIFGNGNQTRDFTYIDDTVNGILLAAEEDRLTGDVVNIAYGKERSINEVANVVLKFLKKENLGLIYQEKRPGDVIRHYADTSKAKNILGFKAKIFLETGIEKYIKWLMAQKLDLKQMLKHIDERNW